MENLNITDKIDSIKDDYTYYTYDLTDSNITYVFGIIYALFDLRIARTRLRKECIELKEEIKSSAKNKSIKEENLEKLDTIIIEYDNIVKEAQSYYENYSIIIYKLESNYINNCKKVDAKNIYINSCKDIIEQMIKIFINYEKKIIFFIDLLKDIKKIFLI